MPNIIRQLPDDNYLNRPGNFYQTRRLWALIVLVLQLITIAWNTIAFFQIRYQLDSPLIPHDIVYEITKPYLFCAFWMAGTFIVSLLLLYRKRHLLVIIFGGTALLVQLGYLTSVQSG